jgi:hypothetical protein
MARAELIEPVFPTEPALPIEQPLKAYRPLPLPAPRPVVPAAVTQHRPPPVRAVAAMLPPRPQSHCAWFECNQFVIVGMGF